MSWRGPLLKAAQGSESSLGLDRSVLNICTVADSPLGMSHRALSLPVRKRTPSLARAIRRADLRRRRGISRIALRAARIRTFRSRTCSGPSRQSAQILDAARLWKERGAQRSPTAVVAGSSRPRLQQVRRLLSRSVSKRRTALSSDVGAGIHVPPRGQPLIISEVSLWSDRRFRQNRPEASVPLARKIIETAHAIPQVSLSFYRTASRSTTQAARGRSDNEPLCTRAVGFRIEMTIDGRHGTSILARIKPEIGRRGCLT